MNNVWNKNLMPSEFFCGKNALELLCYQQADYLSQRSGISTSAEVKLLLCADTCGVVWFGVVWCRDILRLRFQ
jgi:hypothetical protein